MCVSVFLCDGIAHERLGNWELKHGSWSFCFIFLTLLGQGWIVQASEGYLKQRLQARGCRFTLFVRGCRMHGSLHSIVESGLMATAKLPHCISFHVW